MYRRYVLMTITSLLCPDKLIRMFCIPFCGNIITICVFIVAISLFILWLLPLST